MATFGLVKKSQRISPKSIFSKKQPSLPNLQDTIKLDEIKELNQRRLDKRKELRFVVDILDYAKLWIPDFLTNNSKKKLYLEVSIE